MRVFVVDDERIIRVSVADELRDAGHQVNEFASAEAALSEMRNIDVDLIITDLSMPGMNGIEFMKKARELHKKRVYWLCKKELIEYYEKKGFILDGKSEFKHGGFEQYQMHMDL